MEDFHTCICPWNQEKLMWSMVDIVREVRSWKEYIIDMDHCLFRKMSVLDPRNNLDHYLILGYLRSTTMREHEN